ncbi:MAG TPA: N-acetyl-gamma-glutamyl-phosphate reductase [Vicinamibacteria bacterium]|nr:N-acetyl-gamma-glutamyl-phosphate reductase [Vicinamibacteria bacterium]
MSKTHVGVFGATGYTGQELVRLLAGHPQADVAFTTGSKGGHLPHEAGLERAADVYMLALPHGIAATYATRLRAARPSALVVDLSGDLRLPDAASYRRWYGHDHPAPELLGQAVYGLTEVKRGALAGARLVSNPGCYATSVLLPLVPLLAERLVDPADIVADAKSGATGAGRTLREDLLFCEVAGDFSAYAPGRSHRHVGEVEALLEEATGQAVALTFCPHLLPVKRGILSALYVRTSQRPQRLREAIAGYYAGSPFVRVVEGAPPRLSDVERTNACLISVHEGAPGRAVVFSALDNLVKGAAGQAIQNMNVALGLPETAGLPLPALAAVAAEAVP